MTPTTTDINALVAQHVIGRMFGIFDPRVNVLSSSLAMERAFPRR